VGGCSRYSDSDLLAVPALRKDGSPLSVEFTITPIHSGAGGLIGLVAVIRDVTVRFNESKELRRQLQAFTRPGALGATPLSPPRDQVRPPYS
jgi:hypothetical protein